MPNGRQPLTGTQRIPTNPFGTDEIYALSRTLLGRPPDSPDNKFNYLELMNQGLDRGEIVRRMLIQDRPVDEAIQRGFFESLGFDYNPAEIEARRGEELLTSYLIPEAQPSIEDVEAFGRVAEQMYGSYYAELLTDYQEDVTTGKVRASEDLDAIIGSIDAQVGNIKAREVSEVGALTQQMGYEQIDVDKLLGTMGAREAATERDIALSKGYTEEDLAKLTKVMLERKTEFMGELGRETERAVKGVRGTFADVGRLQAGERFKKERETQEAAERKRMGYEREYKYERGGAVAKGERQITGLENKLSDAQREYQYATGGAKEAARRRVEGLQRQVASTKRESEYQRGTAETRRVGAERTHGRTVTDIETAQKRYERELARKRQEAISGSIEQQKEEYLSGIY